MKNDETQYRVGNIDYFCLAEREPKYRHQEERKMKTQQPYGGFF